MSRSKDAEPRPRFDPDVLAKMHPHYWGQIKVDENGHLIRGTVDALSNYEETKRDMDERKRSELNRRLNGWYDPIETGRGPGRPRKQDVEIRQKRQPGRPRKTSPAVLD